MDAEIKARWVAALRSGEYKQATHRLRENGAHCCLGVLCDLFAKERGNPRWTIRELSEQAIARDYDKGLPGPEVVMWSGLDIDAKVEIGGARNQLYNHNDDGYTFAEIADAIEKQL